MIVDELTYRIRSSMDVTPTAEQESAIEEFCRFMIDRDARSVMILRGSAGTGKTTLAAAIVNGLMSLQQQIVLLAPTGRSAKVFSLYANTEASTIHRRIYRQRTAGDLASGFQLGFNAAKDTLFIVDEASMINNELLDDLVQYVYSGSNCRLMLIGDRAQLPPVGESDSPALLPDVLRSYYMKVHEADLNQVLRQSEQSGILWNATMIRGEWREERGERIVLPKIRFLGFADIHVVSGDELIDQLGSSYSRVGTDGTIVITRSNKRANIYNRGIRSMILDREEELCYGDKLMIVKNNYKPTQKEGNSSPLSSPPSRDGSGVGFFIANGDHAVVRRVRNHQELYGFRFADVTMTFPDYDDTELTCTVILDTLTSDAPALTSEQQQQLYEGVLADYADIRFKSERMKKLKEDRYYNALQIKYGYAVTCHKAQGGQWEHVYIDQGYMTDEMLTPEYIHWLYTAFTRATEQLYLVNWPDKMIGER